MSNYTTSKKRPSSVSSRNRSTYLSVQKPSAQVHQSRPSFSESKPDFRVYHSNSTNEDQLPDPVPTDQPITEDVYAHRKQPSNLTQRTSSFSNQQHQQLQNQYQSLGSAGRNMSEPSNFNTLTEQNMREASFHSHDVQPFNEDVDAPPFGMYHLAENPEMAETFRTLENRFLRLEKRLETNEGLIHLHDEMQRLNHMEKRNMRAQEENVMHEVSTRISALEQKMSLLEGDLRSHRGGLDQRLGDFTRRIEGYLERFVVTTSQLGQKFDMLASMKEKEASSSKEKVSEIEGKLDSVAEETRERLKTLYDTVENVGKVTKETADSLENEKYNIKRLEDDFLRLLSTSKDLSQSTGDVRWLSEELFLLKNRQMSILNYLNFGVQGGDESQGYDSAYKRG